MTQANIEINCDLGEASNSEGLNKEAQLLKLIQRCNIACGAHAGDARIMRQTLIAAKEAGVICGAHPGYPDRKNFGRRSLAMDFEKLSSTLFHQIKSLQSEADKVGIKLAHIKLHGALYNDAESDPQLAHRICRLFANQFGDYAVLCLAGGEMMKAAQKFPLQIISEGFIDRRYGSAEKLQPRTTSGSVYHQQNDIIEQAKALALGKSITCGNGISALIKANSLCLHGDRKDALQIAEQLNQALISAKVLLQPYQPQNT